MLDKNKLKPHKHHGRHGTCMLCAAQHLQKTSYELYDVAKRYQEANYKRINRIKDLWLTIGDAWMK